MRRTFKITSVASSPMNKGSPAFGAERPVKPSAQPTLVRTNRTRESPTIVGKTLALSERTPISKPKVRMTVGSTPR